MGSEAVRGVLPRVYPYVKKLDALLRRTLEQRGVPMGEVSRYAILEDGMVAIWRVWPFLPPTPPTVWRACTLRY